MRRFMAVICLCLGFAVGAARADRTFVAVLDGEQAGIPAVTATGSAVFVLNDDETELCYHIEYTGVVSENSIGLCRHQYRRIVARMLPLPYRRKFVPAPR